MIAGLCNNQIIAPFIIDRTVNGDVFETYIKKVLVPELKPNQVVVMDNINFHKPDKIKELIENAGYEILFLPTYSPDLNPIEHFWFKIKNNIKKINHNLKNIWDSANYVLSVS